MKRGLLASGAVVARLLAECFQKARAGQGQVVFLVGEPRIGKSRLLVEFRRSLGTEATWVEERSMSFGRAIAFHPLIDLLRRTFRIEGPGVCWPKRTTWSRTTPSTTGCAGGPRSTAS